MSEREAIIREIAKKKVVHQLPGMEALPVRRDLTYRSTSGSQLPLDIYYPPGDSSSCACGTGTTCVP
jgi:hypothetical protein